jgi:hypothetical protein
VPLKKDKGMKELLKMDTQFKKIMLKVATDAFEILVGKTTKGNRQVQVIINKFRLLWETQQTFDDLEDSTKDKKDNANPREDFILVSSGDLGKAVRKTIKVRIVGNKITATVDVPQYGIYIQNGTNKMPPRPFFTIKGYENIFFGLIESLLTLEFNKLGIRAKEL